MSYETKDCKKDMQVHGVWLSNQQHRKTSRSRPCVGKGLQEIQAFQKKRKNEIVIMAQYIDKDALVAGLAKGMRLLVMYSIKNNH
jgi:hypothetical protein